jgi:hypothetical protein
MVAVVNCGTPSQLPEHESMWFDMLPKTIEPLAAKRFRRVTEIIQAAKRCLATTSRNRSVDSMSPATGMRKGRSHCVST